MNQIAISLQRALHYTIIISSFYIIFKFFSIDSPTGIEFLEYIIPMVLIDVVFITLPILTVIFYFRDSDTLENMKENILTKYNPEIKNQEMLREYHGMLIEGIITQDEYDSIKKKYLSNI